MRNNFSLGLFILSWPPCALSAAPPCRARYGLGNSETVEERPNSIRVVESAISFR